MGEFIEDKNIIANSAILFAPPKQDATSMDDGTFRVDFSKFLEVSWTRMGNLFLDHKFDDKKQAGDQTGLDNRWSAQDPLPIHVELVQSLRFQ